MSSQGKSSSGNLPTPIGGGGALAKNAELTQLDFELEFFAGILDRHPEYVDVLRVHGNNLTLKGLFADGLKVDKRLVKLRPADALAHYNLACSLSLLRKRDSALKTLRQAIELGYRDFQYMLEDRDLDFIRNDPRFGLMMNEFEVA